MTWEAVPRGTASGLPHDGRSATVADRPDDLPFVGREYELGLTATGLRSTSIDEAIAALRAVVEHRDDLIKQRTQTINRLYPLVTKLVPAGAPTQLTAATAARLLRTVRPRDVAGKTLRHLAADLVAEARRLDRRITDTDTDTDTDIAAAVEHTGSTLTQLYGIGTGPAGKILARVGTVHHFRSAAAFASYTGTAPIEVSSGEVKGHRLSRAGDRQLDHAPHMMALCQIRHDTEGHAYSQRKRAAGKSHKEAMRCLKRRLSDVVYRQLLHDAERAIAAGQGRTLGDGTIQRG